MYLMNVFNKYGHYLNLKCYMRLKVVFIKSDQCPHLYQFPRNFTSQEWREETILWGTGKNKGKSIIPWYVANVRGIWMLKLGKGSFINEQFGKHSLHIW